MNDETRARWRQVAVYFGLADERPGAEADWSEGPHRRRYVSGVAASGLLVIGLVLVVRRSFDDALGWVVITQLLWWAEVAIENDGRLRAGRPVLAEFVTDLLLRVPVLFGIWAALSADRPLWAAAAFSLIVGVATAGLEVYGNRDAPAAADPDRDARG